MYKLLAKVLANRLREVLSDTISSAQGALMKEKQILDAVLISNEALEKYSVKRKRGLVFKVDFEKIYDHVRGQFLDMVMGKKVLVANGENG